MSVVFLEFHEETEVVVVSLELLEIQMVRSDDDSYHYYYY
jgi:hypothetical protein